MDAPAEPDLNQDFQPHTGSCPAVFKSDSSLRATARSWIRYNNQ
jgi:hypothetical protein